MFGLTTAISAITNITTCVSWAVLRGPGPRHIHLLVLCLLTFYSIKRSPRHRILNSCPENAPGPKRKVACFALPWGVLVLGHVFLQVILVVTDVLHLPNFSFPVWDFPAAREGVVPAGHSESIHLLSSEVEPPKV